jgi:hypothetical protein
MRYATHGGLVVEPQNLPTLRMARFTEFGPQNLAVKFRQESEAARCVIVKGVSSRRNIVWSAWASDAYSRS